VRVHLRKRDCTCFFRRVIARKVELFSVMRIHPQMTVFDYLLLTHTLMIVSPLLIVHPTCVIYSDFPSFDEGEPSGHAPSPLFCNVFPLGTTASCLSRCQTSGQVVLFSLFFYLLLCFFFFFLCFYRLVVTQTWMSTSPRFPFFFFLSFSIELILTCCWTLLLFFFFVATHRSDL